jgi:predicted neuraminidase
VLDDAALSALLAKVYRPEAAPGLRAVGIRVNVAIERSHDLATRSRILRLATQAGVWAVPVFVLVE